MQKHLLKLISALLIAAIGLQVLNVEIAFYLLLTASFIGLLWIIQVSQKVQKLAFSFSLDKNQSVVGLVQAVKEKIVLHETRQSCVAEALDKIAEGGNGEVKGLVDGLLGDALVNLQNKLSQLKSDEQQQAWKVHGLAQVAEIRKNHGSLEDYAFHSMTTMVKYLKASQGVFYALIESPLCSYLELVATYAYGKRRYNHERISVEIGAGLVGQCVLEKDIIFLKQVPKDYVKITSGLGEASPRCITIVPLIFRDNVFGVIEIASFQVLENYQLDFIRKASESIASELSGIQMQEQTQMLLEQSQRQTLELKAQEEELRQNMEEMQATHEEMHRKEIALQQKLKEIEEEKIKSSAILESCADGVISFDEGGTIIFFNKAAQEIFGYTNNEWIGQSVFSILSIHITSMHTNEPILQTDTGNEIASKTEVNTINSKGDEISLLLTPAKVRLNGCWLFTLFIQRISVELF